MTQALSLLLVEDNPADVDLIRDLMSESGPIHFELEVVDRLAAAIERGQRGGIDLALLDLGLPDSNGLESFLSFHRAVPGVATVVLTGNDDQDLAIAAVTAGAQDFLVKGEVRGNLLVRAARHAVERQRADERERLARDVLECLNQTESAADTIRDILRIVKNGTGCDAVGIRLREGDDFPYCETQGFPDQFLQAERYLCTRDQAGRPVRDAQGNSVLECMCGSVLCGRTNAELPFFTRGGSFWTGSTTDLLASTTEDDRQARTRNRCNGEGYESVALVPLRVHDEIVGLLQLNDRRRDQFTEQLVGFLEGLGASIGIALARRQAEEAREKLHLQLLQAQKMESVGRLAGGIAHDFNNLLTVINGTAVLASMGLADDNPLRLDLQEIGRAGERAASLTRQLLAFSRMQVTQPSVLNLGSVVADMHSLLKRVIREDIDLVLEPAPGLGNVRADPGQIEQVIMNLAVNARDAMPTGGSLTIETRNVELDQAFAADHPAVELGPHVLLAVSDTGVGMDEATRDRIFEPFFTTKTPGQGTGLGLATVYGIVKQNRGSIWVHTELGRGTTFEIYLPRVDEAPCANPSPRTGRADRGIETILIVEDDQALRHLATRMIQAAGYTVLTASNGEEALLRMQRHRESVHLILTDAIMPGICGSELATRLAETRPGIKVLLMSGYADDAIMRHGMPGSTVHLIAKPFTAEELTRKIRDVLDA